MSILIYIDLYLIYRFYLVRSLATLGGHGVRLLLSRERVGAQPARGSLFAHLRVQTDAWAYVLKLYSRTPVAQPQGLTLYSQTVYNTKGTRAHTHRFTEQTEYE